MSAHWSLLQTMAESEVDAVLQALSADLGTEARRVSVTFEARPGKALRTDGVEADTLGLFVGDTFAEFESGTALMPPQVFLFLQNIWELVEGDELSFREELRTTFLHELGHYLGLDESDLEERGLE